MLDLFGQHGFLFLWTTGWAMATQQAHDVARAWGFEPKTESVWRKRTASGKVRVGTGYIARSMHEPILICTKASPVGSASRRCSTDCARALAQAG